MRVLGHERFSIPRARGGSLKPCPSAFDPGGCIPRSESPPAGNRRPYRRARRIASSALPLPCLFWLQQMLCPRLSATHCDCTPIRGRAKSVMRSSIARTESDRCESPRTRAFQYPESSGRQPQTLSLRVRPWVMYSKVGISTSHSLPPLYSRPQNRVICLSTASRAPAPATRSPNPFASRSDCTRIRVHAKSLMRSATVPMNVGLFQKPHWWF